MNRLHCGRRVSGAPDSQCSRVPLPIGALRLCPPLSPSCPPLVGAALSHAFNCCVSCLSMCGTPQTGSHSSFPAALCSGYYSYPHFPDQETKTQNSRRSGQHHAQVGLTPKRYVVITRLRSLIYIPIQSFCQFLLRAAETGWHQKQPPPKKTLKQHTMLKTERGHIGNNYRKYEPHKRSQSAAFCSSNNYFLAPRSWHHLTSMLPSFLTSWPPHSCHHEAVPSWVLATESEQTSICPLPTPGLTVQLPSSLESNFIHSCSHIPSTNIYWQRRI